MEQIVVTHLDQTTLKLQSKEQGSRITKADQSVELLGNDTVDISVESSVKLVFNIGDKINIIGRDYTLNIPAKERKISETLFLYDLHFEGVQYDLLRASYSVNVDTVTGLIQDLRGEDLTGDMKMFLDVLIANANRVFDCWVLGTYPETTDTKTLSFSDDDNCLSVLQMLCSEDNYNTEFEIITDQYGTRTLNVGATGKLFTHTFEYGKGKGLYELTREKTSSSNIVTKLFAYGSSKNINTSKYRASKLCLPTKSKAGSFVQNTGAIAKYGIWEKTVTFEDIYPHRNGAVSTYDPAKPLEFRDISMNFDLNAKDGDGNTLYLIPGTPAKVHFNTGNLAGYEFEILSYNHSTQNFTIKSYNDDRGFAIPNATTAAFQIAQGDHYVLIDIYQPQDNIDEAEIKLSEVAGDYLGKYSQPNVQYGLTIDKIYLKNLIGSDVESNIVWVGDYIPIKDADLDVDRTIRVKGFSRDLLDENPSYTSLTISDLTVSVNLISRVISGLKGLDNIVRINNLNDPAKARRNYLAAQEVLNMVFDPEGDFYTDKIKPLSIDTTMLSVGAKSMQFGLVGTIFQPNYAGLKNRVVYSGGVLTHYAILDVNEDPRTWNITDGDVTLGTDAAYYVYAKCARVGTGAMMLFSLSKITADSDANYFHFLIGVINSVGANNERALALMYGFTTINGRFIKTGRIQNADGTTYFDLDAGEFRGVFKFTSGDSVETAVSNAQGKANEAYGYASSALNYIDSTLPVELAAIQSQIDGNITSWFYAVEPTLLNLPALDWDTNAKKDTHLGDLYYDTVTGYAYRFMFAEAVYAWTRITDTDVTKALADAAKAQDTADHKRRVFVVQPTDDQAYDVGDLWANATFSTTYTNDLLKCKTKKDAGAIFDILHWEKASKYTDDTAANAAQSTANTAVSNAALAQVAANTANAAIVNITSDNVLSSAEKPQQRKEWNIIAGEKAGIETQADTFGITTEKTTYTAAFGALGDYLNDGETFQIGNIPWWIEDTQLSIDTVIVGATYRTKWAAYYDARTALLNAIAAKAKTLADAAQATANAKKRHFVVQPVTADVYDIGDMWSDGSVLLRCKTAKVAGVAYSAAHWESATTYDSTQTKIDGGLVTSGTIQVAGDTNILAGMTGNGTLATSVRFWAGDTYANRATAPFRVLQDGSVVMTKATVTGNITTDNFTATAGTIGNWEITSGGIFNDQDTAYLIARKAGTSGYVEARVGSNVISSSAGVDIPAWFMNTIENTIGTNTALLLTAAHGYRNYAIKARGDIVMVCGDAISSKLNYMNLYAGSVNSISISNGLRVHVRNASGATRTLYLPSVSDIRDDLGIGTFSVTSAQAVSSTTATVYYVNKGNNLYIGDAIKYSTSGYQTIVDIDRTTYTTKDVITVETTLGVAVANLGTFTAIHEFSVEMSIIGEGSEAFSLVNVYPNGSTWYNNDGASLTLVALGRGDIIKVVAYTRRNVMSYQLIHYKTS